MNRLALILGLFSAAAAADPMEDLTLAALEKRMTLNQMRKEVEVDRAKWPKGDVPGLDFTKGGNAIIVHHESGQHSDPIGSTLKNAPPFKLLHLQDDPYRLTLRARGIGLDKGEDKAKYRSDTYKPALQQMQRAKYALFIIAKVKEPETGLTDKFTSGKLEGSGVLYEIESKKLLGGFPLEARNSDKVTTRTGDYQGQELHTLMFDFENNARAALWKALKARFPSAKQPTIAYLNLKSGE